MKKIISFILLFSFVFFSALRADEGMWLINLAGQLNVEKMKSMGLELTAEQIYSINKSSLKDAIAAIDHGTCTGEFISSKGLLLTNHHCAYNNIQELSSLEHDYLTHGFWARNFDEEIPIEGKTISMLVKVEEITQRVMKEIENDTDAGKNNLFMMRRIYGRIEKEKNKESDCETSVSSMFGGNKYYLFYYKTYKDVRLVGAPPSSIGSFGGDTDNWMWPQHKGDFTLYRVYCSPDGTPSEYSKNNVPFKPDYHLKISLKGIEDNDFTMVMGYPFSTERTLTSYGVEELINILNPALINVSSAKLEIIKDAMNSDAKTRIQYSAKYFNGSNVNKYTIGQNKYLKKYDVVNLKRKQEAEFISWVNEKESRKKKYGNVLAELKENYEKRADYEKTDKYYQESIFKGCDLIPFAFRGKSLQKTLEQNPDKEKIDKKMEWLKTGSKKHFKDYNFETDKKLFASGIEKYMANVHEKYIPDELKQMLADNENDYTKLAEFVYNNSFFANPGKLDEFTKHPKLETVLNDPAYIIACTTHKIILKFRKEFRDESKIIRKNKKLFIEGLLEMNDKKAIYPDANSTMRITYGEVGGYSPRDAVIYNYYTTIDGYLEKEIDDDLEFDIKDDFKSAILTNDFGQYADKNGKLRIDFLTNTDITGGNSGSPVLNSKGELVGIVFDGNWESMTSDIYFHPTYNKTVCVDIRYVLFVIDKYANAQNLMSEINIVK